MSLASMFLQAKTQAARTGQDRPLNLSGGARLIVRVRDGVVTLTIARSKKRVGDTELATFRQQCGVPETARRIPAEGQGQKGELWYVAYKWTEEPSE